MSAGASRPQLEPSQRARVVALVLLACALVLPSVHRLLRAPEPSQAALHCTEGAWRRDGRVFCEGPGTELSDAEAFVLGTPINVNRADETALQLIPGLGARLSARIVADRAARGPFEDLGALSRVSGVGPKLLAKISRYARAGAIEKRKSDGRPPGSRR